MKCSVYLINTNEIPIILIAKGAIYYVTIAAAIFFTCEDNMLFSRVKISCWRAKAHLVFHWCLYNKIILLYDIQDISDKKKTIYKIITITC